MKKIVSLLFILVSIPFYGQWWVPQSSGTTANLNDVYAIDGNTVLIVGVAGVILKTTDGGTHWVQKNSGSTNDLMKVQFINSTVGYAVGGQGTLLKTIDAGENWVSISTGITSALYGLSCINENVFYISGDNGLIKKTIDGGVTFTDQSYAINQPIKLIQFLNEQVGYASSYDYTGYNSFGFFKTIDGGANWTILPNQGTTFFFLNENIGFITSNGLKKTVDGGLNLTDFGHPLSGSADLFSLNANEIWGVNNSYTLCGCSSFCIHRATLTNEDVVNEAQNCYPDTTNPPFTAITFADATHGYVVGNYGVIYKNSTGTMQDLDVNEFDKSDGITISPNPAANLITLENKSNLPINTITIADLNGRNVLETNVTNTTVDVSSLSKGLYLLQFVSGERIITKKLLKK